MEVIIDFLSRDPDYPILTGCVYNASNMPPWAQLERIEHALTKRCHQALLCSKRGHMPAGSTVENSGRRPSGCNDLYRVSGLVQRLR
ncbi:MAG: hypothetical protein LC119_16010 [Burkholderiales bacterium]|nr:hypothetical protein [Burkholderiales bacterium]